MKKATTLDEQIELYKSRGCELDMPVEEIENILLNVGYYHLGFYAFPFEETYPETKNRTHQYKKGTMFSEIYSLYKFDFDLRLLLLKYTNHLEINFRAKLVYMVSNFYKNNPIWFIDPEIMNNKYVQSFDRNMYNMIKDRHKPIKQHHKKYTNDKYAPVWKTFEYSTFGNLVRTYKYLLNSELQTKISATYYSIKNKDVMLNYIQAIKDVRDVLSHIDVLFDYKAERPLKNSGVVNIDNKNKNKLYPLLQIMQYLLKGISQDLSKEMERDVEKAFNALSSNKKLKQIVENCSGYFLKERGSAD